jgi:glyoxylase-like metal-dependent hydrolase (beta-lactamase superfamily II)
MRVNAAIQLLGLFAVACLFGIAGGVAFADDAQGGALPNSAAARSPGLAPLPRVTAPRLYVLDCGTLVNNRPEDYNLTREQVEDTNMSVTCFLVIHPKGILLFDTGLSDLLVGRPLYENYIFGYGQIKMNTLRGQLADIGVAPADITYLALSHSHIDHIGNANDYAGSIWLAQKAEMDAMFAARPAPPWAYQYVALKHARTQVIEGDHDVFGDGTVILKFTPGHTPGHQSLYVKLARTGGVLISGDLYHYSEERLLNRMPAPELKTLTPQSRTKIEEFLQQEHAQLWIGHSMAFFRDATKAPGWYE